MSFPHSTACLDSTVSFIEDCLKDLLAAKSQVWNSGVGDKRYRHSRSWETVWLSSTAGLPFSYQHAFVYIRQLALHLRTAMQKKTPRSFSDRLLLAVFTVLSFG
jgi:hypothetical protein